MPEANWTSEDDEFLIDFVKNHEELYNIRCRGYRNAQLKKSMWVELSFTLNRTDIECSKRWAYVRDYYIRRKGKPGTGSCGEAAKKRSDLLSFLDGFSSSKRSTITNLEEVGCGNVSLSASVEEICCDESEMEFPQSPSQDLDASTSSRKRRKTSRADERLQLLKQLAERKPTEMDETTHFMLSMAKIMAKLPTYEQAKLRLKIGIMVGEAEIQNLELPLAGASPPYFTE